MEGQYPVFLYPEFPLGYTLGAAAVTDRLDSRQHFLFTEMAGNMQHFFVRSENYQNVTQRYEVSECYWAGREVVENATNKLAQSSCHKPPICKKRKKMQHLQSAIKQITVK